MAKNYLKSYSKKAKKIFSAKNWQESTANLILGGIIVVILGLLIANFFSKRGGGIDNGIQTTLPDASQVTNDYKVQAGDSLSKISQEKYGTMDLWPAIARANSIANPNIIFVDNTIKLPAKEEAEKIKAEMTQTSYKVQAGDTLFKIAEKMYGDGSKWIVLFSTNKLGRLPNGNPLVYADSTIVIPR